jgi:hypothetical protein
MRFIRKINCGNKEINLNLKIDLFRFLTQYSNIPTFQEASCKFLIDWARKTCLVPACPGCGRVIMSANEFNKFKTLEVAYVYRIN